MRIVESYLELIDFSRKNPDLLCFVDFYATWCGPCKLLDKVLAEWHKEFQDIAFFKINTDDENHEETIDRFNISSLPSILFLKNGATLKLIVGFDEKQIYNSIIELK